MKISSSVKKILKALLVLFFILLFYFVDRFFGYFFTVFTFAKGSPAFKEPFSWGKLFLGIKQRPLFLSFDMLTLSLTLLVVLTIFLIMFYWKFFELENHFRGVEQGSTKWGNIADSVKYISDPPKGKPYYYNFNNVVLTATEGLSMDTKKTLRNLNILVIGGSGAGKTRFFVKPNIMQMHSSYAITDPKGEILRDTGMYLMKNGYKLKVFNLVDMEYSDKYNPFKYIKSDSDILRLIDNIITNTTPPESKSSDPFWEKAETALLQAFFAYILYELPSREQNIGTVMELIRLSEVREEDESYMSPVDRLFANLESRDPLHFAVKQYKIFKLAAGKTAKSILVSIGVRLSAWNIKELRDLMSDDTMDFDKLGDEKIALFIIVPDSARTFNFVAAMMYQQMFDILYYRADNFYNGSVPVHVRFMLDEFANIGRIPNFDAYLATMRSRNISSSIIIQNLAQLKAMYGAKEKDAWENIVGNCDSLLFLGGREFSTLEYISKTIGKTTYYSKDFSVTESREGSYSKSTRAQGRELLMPEEVGRLDNKECLLVIRGEKPFKSKKFDIKSHPRFKETAEATGETFIVRKRRIYELLQFLFTPLASNDEKVESKVD